MWRTVITNHLGSIRLSKLKGYQGITSPKQFGSISTDFIFGLSVIIKIKYIQILQQQYIACTIHYTIIPSEMAIFEYAVFKAKCKSGSTTLRTLNANPYKIVSKN